MSNTITTCPYCNKELGFQVHLSTNLPSTLSRREYAQQYYQTVRKNKEGFHERAKEFSKRTRERKRGNDE